MRRTRITTAREMADAVMTELPHAKIVLMSAAVSDYTFESTSKHKIKKGNPDPEIKLTPTTDILKTIAAKKADRIIVGFALETENVLENALKKLRDKHLDIVVANNPLSKGSGFQGETNQVFIIHRGGRVIDLPLMSKREVARKILDAVLELYRNPEPEPEPEPDLDLEVDESAVGNVHLEGLDMLEEMHDAEPELNGNSKRTRGRRGGRRAKRARERKEHHEHQQSAAKDETPVKVAAAEPEKKSTRKRAVKRATKKAASPKTAGTQTKAVKTSAKKTATKKSATKKTATKKATRKTTRKKAAPVETAASDADK
jgi:hypothetical protein